MKRYRRSKTSIASVGILALLVVSLAVLIPNIVKIQTTQHRAAGQCVSGCIDTQTKLNKALDKFSGV